MNKLCKLLCKLCGHTYSDWDSIFLAPGENLDEHQIKIHREARNRAIADGRIKLEDLKNTRTWMKCKRCGYFLYLDKDLDERFGSPDSGFPIN